MAKVQVEVEEADVADDDGNEREGLTARCTKCGHEAEVFGTSEASVRRARVMLREECPLEERNYYQE